MYIFIYRELVKSYFYLMHIASGTFDVIFNSHLILLYTLHDTHATWWGIVHRVYRLVCNSWFLFLWSLISLNWVSVGDLDYHFEYDFLTIYMFSHILVSIVVMVTSCFHSLYIYEFIYWKPLWNLVQLFAQFHLDKACNKMSTLTMMS